MAYRRKKKDPWCVKIVDNDALYEDFKLRFNKNFGTFIDFLYYEYSLDEILSAPYCLLDGTLHYAGYPKPENTYVSKTFDMSNACTRCHMGRKQDRPFRVSKLAKSGFWQFFAWEPSVYFVSDEVYDSVFAPYGIERRPLMKTSKEIVQGTSQLEFPVSTETLDLYAYKYEICPVCGKKRFINGEYQRHPYFPLHKDPISGGCVAQEIFGSGRTVDQPVIITAEIVKKLLSLKEIDEWRLIPCTTDIEQYWGPKSSYDPASLCVNKK